MSKKGKLEQWQELGQLCKETNDKLVDLCVKADQIMSKKDWRQASRAQKAMFEFRSHAEDIMFKQLGERGGATINIFYGNGARFYH